MATLLKLFRLLLDLFSCLYDFLFYFGPPPLLLVKCVRLSGHSSRFQNYFRISSISYQKNWIGVWILSISPPPLLFLFILFDLLIKVQVQVACLSERTYRESQKLHVCICLHLWRAHSCALKSVQRSFPGALGVTLYGREWPTVAEVSWEAGIS